MLEKLKRRYIIKNRTTGKYIATMTLPPKRSTLCTEESGAYRFHDKEWIKEKIRFYNDFKDFDIIDVDNG